MKFLKILPIDLTTSQSYSAYIVEMSFLARLWCLRKHELYLPINN